MASSVIQENGAVVDTTVYQDTNQPTTDSVCGRAQVAQELITTEEVVPAVEGA